MDYKQYIVKKRFKGAAIDGYVNIPYGTICDVIYDEQIEGNVICYKDNQTGMSKRVCVATSQNAKDFFWGYNSDNPEKEILRQKLANTLFNSAPKDTGDELLNRKNPWNEYGELLEYGVGMYVWQWKSKTLDLPAERLQYLIDCIKKGVAPLCIK